MYYSIPFLKKTLCCTRALHNNSISLLPMNFSRWANDITFYTTYGNPSECTRVLDPQSGQKTVCDCASGYFGDFYCEKIDGLIRLPLAASERGVLSFTDSRLVNGSASFQFHFDSSVFFPETKNITLAVSGGGDQHGGDAKYWTVGVPVVTSVFLLTFSSGGAPFGCFFSVNITLSLRDEFSQFVSVCPNPNMPLKFTYTLNSTNVTEADGIVEVFPGPDGFVITGRQFNRSGIFTLKVLVREVFTGEITDPFTVNLYIQDCGDNTCNNGGTCHDDGNPFNNVFNCTCLEGFNGTLCQNRITQSTTVTVIQSSSSGGSSIPTAAWAGIGAGVGLLLILLGVFFVRNRRLQNLPHNFEDMLELVSSFTSADEGGARIPREVKRQSVSIVGNLGKGNFGTVDKAILYEHHALGVPGYLVGCKQLLSKRSEDRTSLLEEAVVMAQFDNPHCVALIGVVTIGNPVMVCDDDE